MEITSQELLFPAAYAPITEEEMIYIAGGDDIITPQQFAYNLVTNTIRLLGQAAFSNAVDGLINMRNDGLTLGGSIKHFWKNQSPVGKVGTFVFSGFAGYAIYVSAVQLINTALGIYQEVKDTYYDTDTSAQTSSDPTAATTAALTAA